MKIEIEEFSLKKGVSKSEMFLNEVDSEESCSEMS